MATITPTGLVGGNSGTLLAAAAANGPGVAFSLAGAVATLTVTVSGTFTATVNFFGTEDGVNWQPLLASTLGSTAAQVTSVTAPGTYQAEVAGLQQVVATVSGYSSGTVTATMHASAAQSATGSGAPGAGGLAVTDETAWTAGTSQFTPTGGVFNDSAAALSSGQGGEARLTTNRAVHTNLRDYTGTEVGTTANPLVVNTRALIGTTDGVGASAETGTVYNGTTPLTPLFAKIVASSSGVTNIVALTVGKSIRVLKWSLLVNAAVNVKWQSHVTPTDLTGLHYLAANGGIAESFCPVGHFQTVAGEALDINLSSAVAVGGSLVYVLV